LSASVSTLPPFRRSKGRNRLFKSYHASPPPVDICAHGDLSQPLRQTRRDSASGNTADLESDSLAAALPAPLKEPIRVLLTLHAADEAPTSVSMCYGQRHRFRTVLGNAILVVLVGLA
jgi:hypothetical protein